MICRANQVTGFYMIATYAFKKLINEKDDKLHAWKIWNEINDSLCFNFSDITELSRSLKLSKRNVLKILAMFYLLSSRYTSTDFNQLKGVFFYNGILHLANRTLTV